MKDFFEPGRERNRTDLQGFAVLCITYLPPGQRPIIREKKEFIKILVHFWVNLLFLKGRGYERGTAFKVLIINSSYKNIIIKNNSHIKKMKKTNIVLLMSMLFLGSVQKVAANKEIAEKLEQSIEKVSNAHTKRQLKDALAKIAGGPNGDRQKAQSYIKDLSSVELTEDMVNATIEKLSEAAKAKQQEVEMLKAELDESTKLLEQTTEKGQKLQDDKVKLANKIRELKAKLQEKETEVSVLKIELDRKTAELEEAKEKIKVLGQQVKEKDQKITDQTKTLAEAVTSQDKLNKEVEKKMKEIEILNKEGAENVAEIGKKAEEIKNLNEKAAVLEKAIGDKISEIEKQKAEKENAIKKAGEIEKKAAELTEKNGQLHKDLELKIQEMKKNSQEADQKFNTLKADHDKTKKELSEVQKNLNDILEKYKKLSELVQKQHAVAATVTTDLKADQSVQEKISPSKNAKLKAKSFLSSSSEDDMDELLN